MTSGAFISSEVFINKKVWDQKQAQITSIDQKLHLFRELRKEFQRVRILKGKNQINKDSKQVDTLVN